MAENQGYDITQGVAIDPETGEFNPDLIPEEMRESVERMAKYMIDKKMIKNQMKSDRKSGCNRKKKPRVKQPKTYGKNKKKK
jgi:hypothetical protein